MNHEPKLLIEWSSPWEEFFSSIQPALRKSPKPLAGEAPVGAVHLQKMVASWIVEAALIVLAVVLPAKLASLQPYIPPPKPTYDVIYFSGEELPQTEDAGGSKAGRSGHAGGHEAHHRTQTIRVSRGEALRQVLVDAPNLNLPQSDTAVNNLLAFKRVPGPAPTEGLKPAMRAPGLGDTVVAPAPEVEPNKLLRSAPALNAAVIPPSPSAPPSELKPIPIPGSQMVTVVPPPVSAPEQATNLHPLLTLPPPSVVAPPPTQLTRNVATRGPGFGPGELQKQVVPPPVSLASTSDDRRAPGGLGNANVVAPPVQVNGVPTGRGTAVRLGAVSVVAPPVQVDGAANGRSTIASLGAPSVVPPPVQVGHGLTHQQGLTGLGGGSAVVPPPPNVSSSGSASGLGHGNRGNGLGGPLDAGSVAAPPSNTGGNIGGNGIVVSSQPGSKLGVPGNSGAGSLALSPRGGDKLGSGEGQGGNGIASGAGPGSGFSGADGGGARSGTGRGADTAARGGISPYPGGGGAGTGNVSKPPIPGVSVHGGNNVITLPSFGADSDPPSVPGRSLQAKNEGPDIMVVGTSRSGGALNRYGDSALRGEKVYTIYIDTTLGTAVMEFSDPASAIHPYGEDLTAPQAIRADLPANLKLSRLLVRCVLDRSGLVRNAKVLEGNAVMNSQILAALSSWKFRPAFHGDRPVEVTAILGFDIDTR